MITARGGSKGIPGKNIKDLAGKPLISWTIEAAQSSRFIDRLILSSDDSQICSVAEDSECEVPFLRPPELAKDDTSSVDVIIHALDVINEPYDYIVLLQPTSPFRNAEDIDRCLELCIQENAPACVSVTESDKSPAWMYHMSKNMRMSPIFPSDEMATRRQDLTQTYALNGAVYVSRVDRFRESKTFFGSETVAYVMPQERSLDIDTQFQFDIATFLAGRKTD